MKVVRVSEGCHLQPCSYQRVNSKWEHPTFARRRRQRWGGLPVECSCEFWRVCLRSRQESCRARSKLRRSQCSCAGMGKSRIEMFTTGFTTEKHVQGRSSWCLLGLVEYPSWNADTKTTPAGTRWTSPRYNYYLDGFYCLASWNSSHKVLFITLHLLLFSIRFLFLKTWSSISVQLNSIAS